MKESKKWFASSKVTSIIERDLEALPSLKIERHITNTYSWEQGNTTTNSELELCCTRRGDKESSILSKYISERAITTTILVDRQRIMLVSVYVHHAGFADHHVEKCTEQLRGTRIPSKRKHRLLEKIWTLNWCQDTELGVPVLARTHSTAESKEETSGSTGWCYKISQHPTRKNAWKTTYRSPKGTEKQIDYILIKRRHLKYNKDAEAKDTNHMGNDYRCVMATFVINTPEKIAHHETNKDKLETTKQNNRKQTDKKSEKKNLRSKKVPRDDRKDRRKTADTTEAEAMKKNEKKAWAQSKKRSRSGYLRSRWRTHSTSHVDRRGGRLYRSPSHGRRGCERAAGQRDREQSSLSQERHGCGSFWRRCVKRARKWKWNSSSKKDTWSW